MLSAAPLLHCSPSPGPSQAGLLTTLQLQHPCRCPKASASGTLHPLPSRTHFSQAPGLSEDLTPPEEPSPPTGVSDPAPRHPHAHSVTFFPLKPPAYCPQPRPPREHELHQNPNVRSAAQPQDPHRPSRGRTGETCAAWVSRCPPRW